MELTYSAIKNSHHVREADEKREAARRKALLCLVHQYLCDEGYGQSASMLLSEATHFDLTQHSVCDNIDLDTVVQDYESYYYVRFQKHPKLFKRLAPQDVQNKPPPKRRPPQPQRTERVKGVSSEPNITEEMKKAVNTDLIIKSALTSHGDTNVDLEDVRNVPLLKSLNGYTAEWRELAQSILREVCTDPPDIQWSDIAGLDEAKRLVKEAVVYPNKYPEIFSGILTPWRGLLLYGPPGTGKTLLAKAVASECRTTFFNISASTIVSKWRGDSEKLVRVLFDLARLNAPSTIFLDELDSLASHRNGQEEHEASRRMKTELMVQLDGMARSNDRVFLLAASNLPWELDPAVLRRLDKHILVDLPNIDAREAMFYHHLPPLLTRCPKTFLALNCNLDYRKLAAATSGYSGSDIKMVCKEAAMQSVRKILAHLESSETAVHSGCGGLLKLETIDMDAIHKALHRTKPTAAHLVRKYHAWQEHCECL